MKLLQTIFFFFLLIVTFSLPSAVNAQEYVPLAPIPQLTSDACDPVNAPESDACKANLNDFVPNAVRLIIQVAGALAVIMIVIGGFQYASTDAIFEKKQGKERIKNAIYGLLLALASFVILNTLNPRTLNLDLNLKPIYQGGIQTTDPSSLPYCDTLTAEQVDAGAPCRNRSTIPFEDGGTGELFGDDSVWREWLAARGIEVNKNNCAKIGVSNCTSLYELGGGIGIGNRPLNGLEKLQDECKKVAGCKITVTGGTEYWLHGNGSPFLTANRTGHRPGGSVVDLSIQNSALNAIIRKGGEITHTGCASGKKYRLNGAIYVDEDVSLTRGTPHWHVCY